MTLRGDPSEAEVHAIVLAAGSSTRMAGGNKLLALFEGSPLVRRVVERAVASRVAGTVVVTGHDAHFVDAAITGLPVRIAHNPDFARGLASSLRAGIAALPASAGGALIVLGDMPAIEPSHLDRMILAFEQAGGKAVIRATNAGQPGNPVILPQAMLARAGALRGDIGARHLIAEGEVDIIDIEIGPAASLDIDTAAALAFAGGIMP